MLCNKIKGVPNIDEIAKQGIEIDRDVDKSDLLLIDVGQEDIYQNRELNSADNNADITAWVNAFFDNCVNDLHNTLKGIHTHKSILLSGNGAKN